jgi:hypothetical protein
VEFILKLQKKVMATEKISIESLPSNLVALPGGISVYDSTGTRSMLLKPSFVSDIKAKGIQSVSSKELEEQGVRIGKGLQLVYPKRQQSLVSFVGTLPAYTLIFTNPSEDTSKHRHELTSEVFQTTTDIELTNAEPTLLNVRRIHDGESIEISRLGHFIALSQQQQPKPSFPPDDLRLYLPPVHIPSQHLGDCAADTIQTALFFADGFQEEFAQRANTVYKNYIHTEQSLLFQVDNPKLKDELRKAYGLSESLPRQEEDALAVFASMVRRYILVRLLDFGTEQEIASLNIPPTTCILPAAVPQMGLVKGRRKSVNLLAGATIARKLSRVFEPSGYLTSNLKLKETEITLLTEHTFFCLLFKLFKQRQMHSMIVELANLFGFESETSKLRAILFPLMQTTKNGGSQSLEAGGHSISMFRFQETWYLQDDNIGIAKPLPQFDPEHFIKTKGNFFISSYTNLTNKSDLIEQGFFTEQELRQGIPQRFVYYGYKYRNGEYFKEKILSKESITYTGRYDAGTTVLFLCFGDIDPESIKGVANQCKAPIEEPALPSTSSESRVKVKVKDLPPDLIAQLTLATPSEKRPNRKSSVPGIRKNIQANLNAFPTTRKTNTANAKNTTRKVKAYTNVKILNQFTAF